MHKTTFIILSASCFIRKGVASLFNTMENVLIYDELEQAKELDLSSPYHVPDFIVVDMHSVNEKDIVHVDNFVKKFHVDTMAINHGNKIVKLPHCKACFELYETEEAIKNKIMVCINGSEQTGHDVKKFQSISEREKNVLQLVAKGNTNKEIADKLFISLHTVITHRKNITKKLGIKTVSGLTVYAILNNIIEFSEIDK
jgi:DNA-binding CsgD family transcriptional regulator